MQHSPVQARTTPVRPIVCIGEVLVDLLAPPVTTTWEGIDCLVPRIGGAPANTAVAIKRLGGHAAFLGCLSDDGPGIWIAQRLADEGVDLSRLMRDDSSQTRLAVVTGPMNRRDYVFYGSPAADTLLTADHVEQASLHEAAAIMVGSLLLLSEPGRSAMCAVLDLVDRYAIPITFDPNPRPKSWPDPDRARELLLPFIRKATILKLSADEPRVLGLSIDEIREEMQPASVFVLTDGANGCWYWYGEERSKWVPTVRVDTVDSTGAGDAFSAALTLRYVEQRGSIGFSDVQFASVVGALATTKQGAMDSLPDRAVVDAMMIELSESSGQ